jgi:CheY-like chemotaxis protein
LVRTAQDEARLTCLALEACVAAGLAGAAALPDEPGVAGQAMTPCRLYLVEDHLIVRDGLCAVLEAAGHSVVGASADPTQALAELLLLVPEVLLLDLNLGGRSGFELLTEVQRRALPLRCIVLTMSAQPHDVAESLRLGAWGYVLAHPRPAQRHRQRAPGASLPRPRGGRAGGTGPQR